MIVLILVFLLLLAAPLIVAAIYCKTVKGNILTIRQKRAMHKKLESHESEFFNANRELCEVGEYVSPKDQAQDFALQLQKELLSQKD